jgi:hypothetical protein
VINFAQGYFLALGAFGALAIAQLTHLPFVLAVIASLAGSVLLGLLVERVLLRPMIGEPVIGVNVADWGIRRMKTRWGTCNRGARRIWLNLELAKKPPPCLEYILVHEMVHLLERHHNDRFKEYMDRFMPQWRLHRKELNRAPLSHESWSY